MNLFSMWKPEYFYRPSKLLSRLRYSRLAGQPFAFATLPWGDSLRVRPAETIGRSILTLGVYDLLVSEVLWRLTDPDETAVDVGANIGYMTVLLANRAHSGQVWAFEPHPDNFADLEHNMERNTVAGRPLPNLMNAAVSDMAGQLTIVTPEGFAQNRGLSSVTAQVDGTGEQCRAVTLDVMFPKDTRVDVMKIDVEGHEMNVLNGGQNLFGEGRVRDCVFESHDPYPNPVTTFFEARGYSVFGLAKCFRGPALVAPDSPVQSTWEAPSLMATREPDRLRVRLAPRGWRCLRG